MQTIDYKMLATDAEKIDAININPDSTIIKEELITEYPIINTNSEEILSGGSEFYLEDDVQDVIHVNTHMKAANIRSSSPEIEEQEGGAAALLIEYKINFLVPDDEQLVSIDKIKSTVKKYIENYQSDAMKKYKQLFKIVYQKYSSKRYLIDNTDTEIIVSRLSERTSKDYKIGKRNIVYEISKPKYIFYNKDNNLILMKFMISNKRLELQIHYQTLVNKLDVQSEEKQQFEKERKQFIDLLERYYIYNLYDHQINNISLEGKSNIIVQELQGFLNDNVEKKFTLDSNLYTIDNSLIEKININNSSRLNIYNDLMVKLQSGKSTSSSKQSDKTEKANKTDKDEREQIINEIKEYLKSSEEHAKLNNEIKDAVRVQNIHVDYIIYKLPNN